MRWGNLPAEWEIDMTIAAGEAGKTDASMENRGLVDTPHGTIQLTLTSETVGRAVCGPETGWLTLDGRPLYAYAMLRRPGGGETWIVDPTYGAVCEPDGDKAGPRVDADSRDRAWRILRDAFVEWLPTRPDIVAGVALAARRREERGVEDRIERLRADLAEAEAELAPLRAAREAAQEAFDGATAPDPGPTP